MSDLIRVYYSLPVAVMHEYATYVVTTMDQGKYPFLVNHYHPPLADPTFIAAANEMGYSDPMRYAVEHEIAHHLCAKAQGQPHSNIIYRACANLPMSMDEEIYANEEHIVNRFQRWVNLGVADSYGQLEFKIKDLPALGQAFLRIARPWLEMKETTND